MLIKRQNPQETTAKAPDNILPSRYGEIASDINGQIYCRDKKGKFQSLCSTAGYAENAGSATNASTASYSLLAKRVAGLPSVGTDVPENAVFTDHTYSFSTGTTNGSFLVNWSIAGQSYNNKGNYEVPIKGLGSAAYKNSSDFIPSSSASNFVSTSTLQDYVKKIDFNTAIGNVDAVSLGGSSLRDILNYVDAAVNKTK